MLGEGEEKREPAGSDNPIPMPVPDLIADLIADFIADFITRPPGELAESSRDVCAMTVYNPSNILLGEPARAQYHSLIAVRCVRCSDSACS